MIFLGDTTIVLFTLVVLCVGALAAGFIADGWGKFRATKTIVETPPEDEVYQFLGRTVIVKADPTPDQLERLRKAFKRRTDTTHLYVVPDPIPHLRELPPPSRLYDQEIDGYI